MSRFLQLHALTFYPPGNVNRDDTGRPKTAFVGGVPRLRISSQALKRAWRSSAAMKQALNGHMGVRTQRFGVLLYEHLKERGVAGDKAEEAVKKLLPVFGKPEDGKGKNPLYTKQLAFISDEEKVAGYALAEQIAEGSVADTKPEALRPELLHRVDTAADIAMFGRMLADSPDYNREAAVQVAHAFTTHRAAVEDDFYTAVDDLKKPAEDAGAGFVGEQGFGSGVFYLYVCINLALLHRNLGGDAAAATLAGTACAALARAMATVTPSGKQNSFAAHAHAEYVLAERGDTQPRTLAGAFAKPVDGARPVHGALMADSIAALNDFRVRIDQAYDLGGQPTAIMDVTKDKEAGSIADIAAFCREAASSCQAS